MGTQTDLPCGPTASEPALGGTLGYSEGPSCNCHLAQAAQPPPGPSRDQPPGRSERRGPRTPGCAAWRADIKRDDPDETVSSENMEVP